MYLKDTFILQVVFLIGGCRQHSQCPLIPKDNTYPQQQLIGAAANGPNFNGMGAGSRKNPP